MKTPFRILLCIALLATAIPVHAQILTDASLFDTNSAGDAGFDRWNTRSGDITYDMWINLTSAPAGVTTGNLNGPNDVDAPINRLLSVNGTYVFDFVVAPGNDLDIHGLNLFFDGSTTPAISAKTNTIYGGFYTGFSANTSANTYDPNGQTVAASSSLSTVIGGKTITMTDFRIASRFDNNQDLIGPYTRSPDGTTDNLGSFTLTVSGAVAPETGSWVLAGAGALTGVLLRRRRA